MWSHLRANGGVGLPQGVPKMSARDFEFGKLNFASDFYHCRYTPHISTTISNDQFVSVVLDLFYAVRFIWQVRLLLVAVDLGAKTGGPLV